MRSERRGGTTRTKETTFTCTRSVGTVTGEIAALYSILQQSKVFLVHPSPLLTSLAFVQSQSRGLTERSLLPLTKPCMNKAVLRSLSLHPITRVARLPAFSHRSRVPFSQSYTRMGECGKFKAKRLLSTRHTTTAPLRDRYKYEVQAMRLGGCARAHFRDIQIERVIVMHDMVPLRAPREHLNEAETLLLSSREERETKVCDTTTSAGLLLFDQSSGRMRGDDGHPAR
ncbi:hypothetical protein NMY22_g2171 [Coprinellus aureogranulatus]|nr:hypothetical protein NMY22_g2171 [Coprinellus aureogranulatus]